MMSLELMMWLGVGVVGFAIALLASRRVAHHATVVVERTSLSPFFVGMVLLAIGTDIPEIVNSIVTSAAGHGDLNVGDSVGSALTQVTLVLGLLPFLTRRIETDSRAVQAIGGLTVGALLLGVLLVGDGRLTRIDAGLLLAAWVAAIFVTRDVGQVPAAREGGPDPGRRIGHVLGAFMFLAIVGGGAVLAVLAMVEIAGLLNVPEYYVSFFGASLGTSLPELMVDVTAIRRGAVGLAIGDAFGSSLVDATLSLGIGPALFPIAVDAGLAVRGGLFAAVAIALVTLLVGWRGVLNRRTGAVLIGLYLLAYFVLLRA